ncbi:MAG: TolC family outer membrane protein [Alphaproteobacteria bacterium]
MYSYFSMFFARFLCIIFLSFYSCIWADTFKKVLVDTYQQNKELRAKRSEVFSQHEKIVQALAGWRPTLTLESSIKKGQTNYSGTRKDNRVSQSQSGSTTNNIGLTLSQNLFSGGATLAEVSSTEKSIFAAWEDLREKEQEIFLKAIKIYLELIAKMHEVELYKANRAALYRNLESAREKMNSGEETSTQVANAEAKSADAEAQFLTAQAEKEGLLVSFEEITGSKAPSKMIQPSVTTLPNKLQLILGFALQHNPSITKARFACDAAKDVVKKVSGKLFPSVDFVASSTRTGARTATRYSGPNVHSNDSQTDNQIMLKLSFPIYSGGNISSQKREALSSVSAKKIAIQYTEGQIRDQIQQSWHICNAAKENIRRYEQQIKAAEMSLYGTREEMLVGTKVLLDVLNAQTLLLEAQLKKIKTQKLFFIQHFTLLSFMGKLNAKDLNLEVDYFDPYSHYQAVKRKL